MYYIKDYTAYITNSNMHNPSKHRALCEKTIFKVFPPAWFVTDPFVDILVGPNGILAASYKYSGEYEVFIHLGVTCFTIQMFAHFSPLNEF